MTDYLALVSFAKLLFKSIFGFSRFPNTKAHSFENRRCVIF